MHCVGCNMHDHIINVLNVMWFKIAFSMDTPNRIQKVRFSSRTNKKNSVCVSVCVYALMERQMCILIQMHTFKMRRQNREMMTDQPIENEMEIVALFKH